LYLKKLIGIFIMMLMIVCTISTVYGDIDECIISSGYYNESVIKDTGNTADILNVITIGFSGRVTIVFDDENLLGGQILLNQPVIGHYVYNSQTPDSDPSTNYGQYIHESIPYGIILNVGPYQFKSTPWNIHFEIRINNNIIDYGNGSQEIVDQYAIRSYYNIVTPLIPNIDMDYLIINFGFEDSTATVFSSDALIDRPPDLTKMNNFLGNRLLYYEPGSIFAIEFYIDLVTLTSAPIPPGPSGPSNRFAGPNIPIKFKMDIDDPELEKVRLGIDWGDGNMEWTDYDSSGATLEVSHLYELPGVYEVKSMAEDEFGLQSEWSSSIHVSVFPGGGVLDWLLSILFPDLFDI
jgi:hypothetical protein